MALRSTAQAGPLTTGATWSGGVAPSSGDTLSISHAVTWAPAAGSSFTLGTGTGTAVTFGAAGSLTITPAGAFTLTFAGSTAGGNTSGYELTVNATNGPVTLNVDATGAGSGFAMVTGGTYSATNLGGWLLNGNATYGISVASLPSDASKNSYFSSGGQYGGGVVNGSYFTLTRIGVASTTSAYTPALDNRLRTLSWDHVTLNACGEVTLSGDASYTGSITFSDVTSTSTATDASAKYPLNATFAASGTRTFTRCLWDKMIKLTHLRGCTFSKNYFHNGWTGTDVTSTWTLMDLCFIRQTFDSMLTSGSVTNCFLYWDNPSGNNPHWLAGTTAPSGTVTFNWSNNIAYYNGTDAAGNVFVIPTTSNAALAYTCNNNLVLPNPAGLSSGTFITSNGNVTAGFQLTANHNTIHTKGTHAFEIGHLVTVLETPRRFASVKGNLFIGGTTGYKAYNVDADADQDLMTPGNVDYNGSYQIQATSGVGAFTNEGRGYAAKWSATPGAHDIDGTDPAFVDPTASLATWAVSLGSVSGTLAGKEADALTYVKADLATRIEALNAYLAAAYRFTAAAFHNAAHDGGDIGAFAYLSTSTTSDGLFLAGGIAITSGDIFIV